MLDVTRRVWLQNIIRPVYLSVFLQCIQVVLYQFCDPRTLIILFFYTQYTYFVLLIIFQESLLKPNTSNINADKLFWIILTSLNCFVSPLCFALKKKKKFCSRFPYKSESNRLSPSLSSFKDLAVHTTLQWFIWSALITCFRLPACLWENPRMYHGQSVSVSCDDSSRPQVVLSMFEKVLEYIDSNI